MNDLIERSYEAINDYRDLLKYQGEYEEIENIDNLLNLLLEEMEQYD